MPCALLSPAAAAAWPARIRPTSARTSSGPCWRAPRPTPVAVDDVVFGCVDTVGPQAGDIARTAWLAAGLPEAVPGVTVDRQCGSSQQAVHFAAQAVLSGTADLVVAGGVQNMSLVPIGAAMGPESPVRRHPRAGGTGTARRRSPSSGPRT